jgi:type IV secretion system protein VirB2
MSQAAGPHAGRIADHARRTFGSVWRFRGIYGNPQIPKPCSRYGSRLAGALAMLAVIALAGPARAAGSGMPWEAPLQAIVESVEGPVAKIIAVIIIIVTGLTLAFGDTAGGFRRLVQIVFGLSIAFAASSFFLTFFQFGGGAVV